MNKYRKSKQAAEKLAAKSKAKAQKQLKKEIGRNRSRAKWVGILYLLGIIAMAATFALSIFMTEGRLDAIIGGFSKVSTDLSAFVVSVLYALMALVAVVNVFKAFGKLGWLHKKKATMEYGFNRNAYAMNDLSGLFTGVATFVFVNYLLINVLTGGTAKILDILMGDMMMLIFFAVAAVIALFADAWGGKVKYYDIDEGRINVEQHLVGRFAGFIRKLIRIVAVAGILYALDFEALHTTVDALINGGEVAFGDMAVLLPLVAFVLVLPLIKRAFRATDYSLDGVGSDKGFAFISFLVLAVGAVLCFMVGTEMNNIIIAAVAAVAFIFELILRRCFKFSEEVEAKKQAKKEAKAAKKAEKKQAKKDKKVNKKQAKKDKKTNKKVSKKEAKAAKKAEKKQIKEDKKQGTRYSREDDKAGIPSNWDDGEFTFETLMRMGNVTVINNK